jgi:hypothetical protein
MSLSFVLDIVDSSEQTERVTYQTAILFIVALLNAVQQFSVVLYIVAKMHE